MEGRDGESALVAALRGEVERLRDENRRLREQLGEGGARRDGAQPAPPAPAWEPTLFPDAQATVPRAPVDGRSSPEAKIALSDIDLGAGRPSAAS